MVIVGLDTLPKRMTDRPATSPSVGLVRSLSWPSSEVSPGTFTGHSSITFLIGSAAVKRGTTVRNRTREKMARFEGMGLTLPPGGEPVDGELCESKQKTGR